MVENSQKWHFCDFCEKSIQLHGSINFELNIVKIFRGRFWKLMVHTFHFNFFIIFSCLFVTKTVLFKILKIRHWIKPFCLQKGIKKCKKFIKFIFSKNMDPKLSNDVFIITLFQTFLEQILGFDEFWSKRAQKWQK